MGPAKSGKSCQKLSPTSGMENCFKIIFSTRSGGFFLPTFGQTQKYMFSFYKKLFAISEFVRKNDEIDIYFLYF